MKRHFGERSCAQCGRPFEGRRQMLYCSEACSRISRTAQHVQQRKDTIDSSTASKRLGLLRTEGAPIVRGLKVRRAKTGEMRCAVCKWAPPAQIAVRRGLNLLHAHHVVPLACGGSNDEENLVILCPNHHALAHRVGQQNGARWYGAPTPNELVAELTALEEAPQDWLLLRAARLRRVLDDQSRGSD